ncbi:hypothetical protein [Halococcus hamelinensis]|uniref:Uncharacterized protein n=1 Tax=Halococcus hamelinensis 100A6 TaxID=1132509 RepID=M0LUZ7_9EURY|nr:hypothetical protein C447_12982 [Halococcus hamelinensis 100A6]
MELEPNFDATQGRRDSIPDADDVYDQDEELPITDLFDDTFVRSHSEFDSFDEMVAASPSTADSANELERVAHREWDEFVAETTDFADERALVMAARDHWVTKRLNLG